LKPTLTILTALLLAPLAVMHAGETKPNILFIAVDDLRPWIRAMGFPAAKTPNFDRLAARSVTFSRAYTAAPWCNPSRTALLTGLRPGTTGVYAHWDDHWRTSPRLTNQETLPQYFCRHGYETIGACMLDHGIANPPLNERSENCLSPA
jgi:arylsulfatase A-like enzyme